MRTAVSTTRERVRKIPPHHAHGCVKCGRRYMDACSNPIVNDQCPGCRTGRRPVSMEVGREPRACCVDSKEVTSVDVMARYALGGPGPWWQCPQCFRTHPFKIKKEAA